MCGRFLLESEVEDLVARYNAEYSMENYKSGEVFPSENPLTVIKAEDEIKLMPMRWGLPIDNSKRLIINARVETVDKKPMFKSSFLRRRCIVPANAFFEWKSQGSKKLKHQINKNGEQIFSIAAIYDDNGFVILTMDSTEKMKNIHNRMPLILSREEESIWLDTTTDLYMLKSLINSPRFIDFHIKPTTQEKEHTLFDYL
ncbi:SOS response-associated peptidase [Lutispora thermophila]|uniref:Abasic site processing protein n=1 Tax=Lutispora thermophila DSM 19022 TaxID=1122184 RepID=A0A1M6EHS0_9FIRM|nr:SOS response-associated peptidase [Lutispora thermophila]SHI85047.1 Putative SOS response-associated peptidase YedK [Lutispora thermophila DSM 19022]